MERVLIDSLDAKVIASCDEDDLLHKSRNREYDVLLLDISIPGSSGYELLHKVLSVNPRAKVIMLSMHNETHYVVRALKEGAKGYLSKDCAPSDLSLAIQNVCQGKVHIENKLAMDAFASINSPPASADRLSNRELQITEMIAKGCSTSDISNRLHIASSTVSTYKKKIREKLLLESDADIVRWAYDHHIVE